MFHVKQSKNQSKQQEKDKIYPKTSGKKIKTANKEQHINKKHI